MDLNPETIPATIQNPSPRPRGNATEIEDGIDSDRVILRNNLRLYIREAWHVIEPSTVYLENWHIDLIAEYLSAVTAGQIKRLLINMPPRYAKSTCVSIMWPTWVGVARDTTRLYECMGDAYQCHLRIHVVVTELFHLALPLLINGYLWDPLMVKLVNRFFRLETLEADSRKFQDLIRQVSANPKNRAIDNF